MLLITPRLRGRRFALGRDCPAPQAGSGKAAGRGRPAGARPGPHLYRTCRSRAVRATVPGQSSAGRACPLAFLRRRSQKERAATKAPLPPVAPASTMPRLRVDGLRLDTLDCAFVQVICDCGHVGEVPVAPLVARYGRAVRVRDALGAVRCSRCSKQTIRKVFAFR